MMREYWNTQENIMVSAWRDGGEVDGKPVTDERLLEFWKTRRDSVQTDDPLWDYYDQQMSQYKFAIEESKVGLAYAQHKMSARAVANWYKGQAGNYSKNSEMWRTVMGQAAKFLDAAKAQSKAATQAARTKAYVRIRDAAYKDYLAPTWTVTGALTGMLRQYGILSGSVNYEQDDKYGMGLYGSIGEGAELTSLAPGSGTDKWLMLLDAINTPGSEANRFWYDNIIPAAKRNGLDISAPFDQTDIENLMHRTIEGYDKLVATDKRFSDVAPSGNVQKLRGQQRDSIDFFQFVMTLDETSIYAQRRNQLTNVLSDPNADPFEMMKAYTDYYDGLKALEQTVGDQNPVFTAALYNEERILLGDPGAYAPTIAEGATASPFTTGGIGPTGETGFAAVASSHINQLRGLIDMVAKGEGTFIRDPNGGWRALTWTELRSEFGSNYVIVPRQGDTVVLDSQADITPTTGRDGGGFGTPGMAGLTPTASKTSVSAMYSEVFRTAPIIVRVPGQASAYTGRELTDGPPANEDSNVGQVVYVPNGEGVPDKAIYGIYSNSGAIRWTTSNPFLPGAVGSQQMSAADASGQQALVVNVNAASAGMTATDKDGNVVPLDSPNVANVSYNPFAALDPNLPSAAFRAINPRMFDDQNPDSFIDPGFAYMVNTQAGREDISKWTVEEAFQSWQASPWIDWNNPEQSQTFWRDFAAVKVAEQTRKNPNDPNSALAAEWQVYTEVKRFRGGDVNSLWDDAIRMSQTASLVRSEAAERVSPSDLGYANPVPPGTPVLTAQNPLSQKGKDSAYERWLATKQGQGQPVVVSGSYAGKTGYVDPSVFVPYYGAGMKQPTGAGQQPAIQTNASIRVPTVPGMPAGSSGADLMPGQGPNMPQQDVFAPRIPTPTPAPGTPPPTPPLPPAPGPAPNIPGVNPRPRPPHEYD